MGERLSRVAGQAGIWNLVLGIVAIVTGVATGVLLLINSVRLLKSKNDVMF